MKLIILILTLSFFINQSFSQDIKPVKNYKQNFKVKKKVFNIMGYSLLGTGAVLLVQGQILSDRQRKSSPNSIFNLDGIGETIFGLGSCLLSVPFFVIGDYYKYKAAKITISNESSFILKQNNLSLTSQPTIL